MVKLSILTLSLITSANAFAPLANNRNSIALTQMRSASSSSSDNNPLSEDSRRSFFTKTASVALAGVSLLQNPSKALALGGGLKKVNAKLQAYGVPPIASIPDGFSPLAEVWGRGKNRDPLLVSFVHPIDWVITVPSQDVNGEDGTIQAGEYAKGDTATFFVYMDPGKVDNISSQPKELFENALIKSISQKGSNIYQNFKVTKLVPKTVDGQEYMICDFKYTLLTGAGFEVDRQGVASVTSVGENSVQVLWTASTAIRWKKTEQQLRTIADSFRCYAGGLEGSKIEYDLDA